MRPNAESRCWPAEDGGRDNHATEHRRTAVHADPLAGAFVGLCHAWLGAPAVFGDDGTRAHPEPTIDAAVPDLVAP